MADWRGYGRKMVEFVRKTAILILFVSIIASVIISIVAYQLNWVSPRLASLIIGGSGTLATFTLALATFQSIRQNNESLRQLQIDREKPIVIDELSSVIQPSIDSLKNNLMHLRSGTIDYDGENIRVNNPVSPRDVDDVTFERFKERHPDLFDAYQDFHELRLETLEKAEEVADRIEPEIKSLVEDTDQGTDYVVRQLLNGNFYVGGTSADFWDAHGDDLEEILVESGGEEWEELKRLKTDLTEEAQSIFDDLVSLKLELQEEYGISNQDL